MSKLYGVCHDAVTGEAVSKLAKQLKVGIGYPKGPAIHAFIAHSGKWVVEWGVPTKEKKPARQEFATRAEAEKFYNENRPKTSECPYPRKFGYFTFLRIGQDGSFQHDFDAIAAHGPLPTEIPIVFVDDDPLFQRFEYWTQAELKCSGDGRDAQRRIAMAVGEQKQIADQCAAQGQAFFPIIGGCHTAGCQYSIGDKPVCKPHSRLSFQLRNAIRLGGTCCYDSTGFRSAAWLFSSLNEFRMITGRGNSEDGRVVGLPIVMKVQPYKVSHGGKPSTQYGVSLQLHAKDAMKLLGDMQATADQYRAMIGAAARQLGAAPDAPVEQAKAFLTEAIEAKTVEAEFYPDESGEVGYEEETTTVVETPTIRRKSDTLPSKPPSLDPVAVRDALKAWKSSGPDRASKYGKDGEMHTCTLHYSGGYVTGVGQDQVTASADALAQLAEEE